jgi:hypothetical protein
MSFTRTDADGDGAGHTVSKCLDADHGPADRSIMFIAVPAERGALQPKTVENAE